MNPHDQPGTAPDGGPWLPLSAKATNPQTAHDYLCDYPGCGKRATTYLFLGPQACSQEHLVSAVFVIEGKL